MPQALASLRLAHGTEGQPPLSHSTPRTRSWLSHWPERLLSDSVGTPKETLISDILLSMLTAADWITVSLIDRADIKTEKSCRDYTPDLN